MSLIKNQNGQSLIEYLILVAIMGIATMGTVRLLNHTITAKFTTAIHSLQGHKREVKVEAPTHTLYKKKDMSTFMHGAAPSKK